MKKVTFIMSILAVFAIATTSTVFAGGSREATGPSETVLRIASSTQGPTIIENFERVMREFERLNPGVRVEWDRSTGTDYEFTGLPSLLESNTPPDIFFEWGGARILSGVEDGYIMDISDLAAELRPILNESAWDGAVIDGRTYMIPDNQDVTIMMWYNREIFDQYNLSPPSSWAELLEVSRTLQQNNITPIVMGNADAWVAGNFGGVFLARWGGDDFYHEVLSMEPGTRLNNDRFVRALRFMQEMAQIGAVNQDLNTLGYRESFTVLLDGSAAMMPMGTWFVDQILEFTEDPNNFPFGYFNLPPFDGGQGHPRSVMGLNTGYVVNANTQHKDLAYDFLRLMVGQEFQGGFVDAGRISTNTAAMQASADPYVRSVAEMLNNTPVLIAPPDTGYNLEMARALYEAIAKAFEGMDPRAALDEAEQKVQFLR